MTDHELEIWKVVFEGIKTLGIVVAALWAAWRFRRERVDAPQIQFSVDVNLHGPSNGAYAAEYVLTFENRGRTRVQIAKIEMRVRGIKIADVLREWEKAPPRLKFTHSLVNERDILPSGFGYTFLEPAIKQDYRYVSIVPSDFKFIIIRGQFHYENNDEHSAERVVTIEPRSVAK